MNKLFKFNFLFLFANIAMASDDFLLHTMLDDPTYFKKSIAIKAEINIEVKEDKVFATLFVPNDTLKRLCFNSDSILVNPAQVTIGYMVLSDGKALIGAGEISGFPEDSNVCLPPESTISVRVNLGQYYNFNKGATYKVRYVAKANVGEAPPKILSNVVEFRY